ncbi:putative transcription factor interactor and regulator CCHC(Zn) family [Helianthus annuus]|nr:putative transcription factor interactor and regulator CCHC(Zn) family [Helianthus annuus]
MARIKKKEVNAVQFAVCEDCWDIGHRTDQCPTGPGEYTEEVNQVFGDRKNNDMNSNTYHPGLRNHPNFRYGNATNQMNPNFQPGNQSGSSYQNRQGGNEGGYQRNYNQGYQGRDNNYQGGYQRNYNNQGDNGSGSNNQTGGNDLGAKMDALLNMHKESHNDIKEIKKTNEIRDKEHEALAKQVGQLAEEMAQIRGSMGKLPSDTAVNTKHQGSSSRNTHEVPINKITLRRMVDMTFGNRRLRLHVFSGLMNPPVDDKCYMADIVDTCIPLYDTVVDRENTMEDCYMFDRSQVEMDKSIDEEVKSLEVLAVREGKPTWTHQVESLPESIDTTLKLSLVEPPEVELKALPKHLKYAYVGEGNTLPVIIASNLTMEQEKKLMGVLVSNRAAIGWTIADLKGISPSVVMHKIITEENVTPVRDAQRRLIRICGRW